MGDSAERVPDGPGGLLPLADAALEFHAEKAGGILAEVGYDQAIVARVQNLLRKKNLKSDPQMQTLEDVACLVFLENDFVDLARQHDAAKMIDIIRKTWKKMSPRGRQAALEVPMAEADRALLQQALSPQALGEDRGLGDGAAAPVPTGDG